MRFALCFLLVALSASAQDTLLPAETITTDGIPAVPRKMADAIDRYGNFRSASFAQWHPERLEMLITTRFGDTNQVHRVTQPMGMREQLTFFNEPVMGVGEYVDDTSFTIRMDTGGNEFFQLYHFNPATGGRRLLTDGEGRHTGGVRAKKTGQLVYQRVDSDADGAFTDFFTVDPLRPEFEMTSADSFVENTRLIKRVRGGGWGATDWSPDGKQLLLNEYLSVSSSRIWLLDVDSGEAKRLLPKDENAQIAYAGGEFAPDGKSFYALSNERGEFQELVHVRLDTLASESLTADIPWDVDEFDLSPDGKRIAYTVNANGFSEMYIVQVDSRRVESKTAGASLIGRLQWHNDSDHLAFTMTNARSPGDVWVRTNSTGEMTQWTKGETGVSTINWPDAEAIAWKSFDDRTITGFINRPPAKFTGLRPVVVIIHGGPEGQSRPGFLGRWNYFLNELGVALIYPNVRGSTGYGKTFANLDNGMKREGTYEDIGALLDWIGEQPGLDPNRIMIYGGSYGGHMTLATATRYSDKIACSVNLFGISNLRTFLENTQGYRRDLRRAEYGDERDAETRAWMDRTAPMAHVNDIRKPMLVQQGVNDPRVPKSESDQIVAALKATGTPVWYLTFDDEGHGFLKKPNADYAFYTVVMFAEDHLLYGVNDAKAARELDAVMAALRAAGKPATIEELEAAYHSAPEAAETGRELVRILDSMRFPRSIRNEMYSYGDPVAPDGPVPANVLTDTRAMVSENLVPLQRMEELLLTAKQIRVPIDLAQGMHFDASHLSKIRTGVRLLAQAATVAAIDGNAGDAERALRAMCALTNTARDEPFLVSQASRYHNIRLFDEATEQVVNRCRLSPEQLLAVQGAASGAYMTNAVVTGLKGERAVLLSAALDPDRYGLSYREIGDQLRMGPVNGLISDRHLESGAYFKLEIVQLMHDCTAIENLQNLDPGSRADAVKAMIAAVDAREDFLNRLPKNWVGPTLRSVNAEIQTSALLDALSVSLATLRFHAAEGKLPETVEHLSPRYLDPVPQDPYSGGALQLLPTERGFVVYSVGPNRKDDRGRDPDKRVGIPDDGDINFRVVSLDA